MLHFTQGNILEDTQSQAIINTVNCVGVMGKGLALACKKMYPENYALYKQACDRDIVIVGHLFITQRLSPGYPQYIINFPTKTHWRHMSDYVYIEAGLYTLVKEIERKQITSLAIPPLGCGNGGLHWPKVAQLIINYLQHLDCNIMVYEPN